MNDEQKMLQEYCNIRALADGRVSGQFVEWPRMKPEARMLLEEVKRLREELAKLNKTLRCVHDDKPGECPQCEALSTLLPSDEQKTVQECKPTGKWSDYAKSDAGRLEFAMEEIRGLVQQIDSLRTQLAAAEAHAVRSTERADKAEQELITSRLELTEAQAESEGRRKALFDVGEERRQAWQRAERAEAELTEARTIIDSQGKTIEMWMAKADVEKAKANLARFEWDAAWKDLSKRAEKEQK